jgi:hypothetical protein
MAHWQREGKCPFQLSWIQEIASAGAHTGAQGSQHTHRTPHCTRVCGRTRCPWHDRRVQRNGSPARRWAHRTSEGAHTPGGCRRYKPPVGKLSRRRAIGRRAWMGSTGWNESHERAQACRQNRTLGFGSQVAAGIPQGGDNPRHSAQEQLVGLCNCLGLAPTAR